MLKYFFSRTRLLAAPPSDRDSVPADWIRDPLAHPEIEAMDERQLGDLPFRAFPAGKAACESNTPRPSC